MTIFNQNPVLTEDAKKALPKLAVREAYWIAQQLTLQAEHDNNKTKKARNAYTYQNIMLQSCKTWGGLCYQ